MSVFVDEVRDRQWRHNQASHFRPTRLWTTCFECNLFVNKTFLRENKLLGWNHCVVVVVVVVDVANWILTILDLVCSSRFCFLFFSSTKIKHRSSFAVNVSLRCSFHSNRRNVKRCVTMHRESIKIDTIYGLIFFLNNPRIKVSGVI